MGKLAWAGALKGAGEGLHEMGQDTMEAQAVAAKQSHDDAREEALLRLKSRLDQRARETGYEHDTSIQQMKGEQAQSLQKNEQGFKGKESENQRQYEAVQTDKKLESAEKIARIGAAAKDTKANKWHIGTIKSETKIDPQTGQMSGGGETTTITSPTSGVTYVQEGTLFLPQDPQARQNIRQPANPAGALKKLRSDPENTAEDFLLKYHWLPADVMKHLIK